MSGAAEKLALAQFTVQVLEELTSSDSQRERLNRRVFVVVEHRRLFAQQPRVGIKLAAMMPVLVIGELKELPCGETAIRRLRPLAVPLLQLIAA
jgi:hypothetical protein